MGKYPEADKVSKYRDKMLIVGDFITWLRSNGRTICTWHETTHYDEYGDPVPEDEVRDIHGFLSDKVDWTEPEGYYPVSLSTEKLLAEFFNIDYNKYEEERRRMMEDFLEATGQHE